MILAYRHDFDMTLVYRTWFWYDINKQDMILVWH